MNSSVGPTSTPSLINFAGFLLLPGLLASLRTLDKQRLKPVDLLRQLAASDNPGLAFVQKAEDLLASARPRGEFVQPTFAQLEARIEDYIRDDRLGAATVIVDQMHRRLNGQQIQPSLTEAEVREKLLELNPPGEMADQLPGDMDSAPGGITVDTA